MTWCFFAELDHIDEEDKVDEWKMNRLWIKQTEAVWREELKEGDDVSIQIVLNSQHYGSYSNQKQT